MGLHKNSPAAFIQKPDEVVAIHRIGDHVNVQKRVARLSDRAIHRADGASDSSGSASQGDGSGIAGGTMVPGNAAHHVITVVEFLHAAVLADLITISAADKAVGGADDSGHPGHAVPPGDSPHRSGSREVPVGTADDVVPVAERCCPDQAHSIVRLASHEAVGHGDLSGCP